MAKSEFSRWRGGDMSFGPAGRIGMTVGLAALAVIGYPLVQGGIFMLFGMPIPTIPAIIGYCLAASPLCAWGLSRIWRRARIA
jgi:hypothetical protein